MFLGISLTCCSVTCVMTSIISTQPNMQLDRKPVKDLVFVLALERDDEPLGSLPLRDVGNWFG